MPTKGTDLRTGTRLADPPRAAGKPLQRALKRGLDIIVGALAGLISLPLCAAVAVLIKLDSPGPVIFSAERVGKNGAVFILYKFRSMVANAHDRLGELAHLNEGGRHMIKIADDPRVTRVGRFLRKYSLDELPQLWNVLRGDMSLVGPRPQAPCEVALYDVYQRRRLSVPAGITGWWQVTARHDPRFEIWVKKDLEYIDAWSIGLDLRVMLKTVIVILAGRGAEPKPTESGACKGTQERDGMASGHHPVN